MTDLLYRAAAVAELDTNTRTVVVQLCAWNEPRPVVDHGHAYREVWAPGSLHLAERAHVVDEHGGALIGRVGELRDTTDGPTVQLHIAHTRAGDDALALVDAGVVDAVSMEFAPDPAGEVVEGDLVTRTAATVHGVAFAFRPAHTAPILSRNEEDMPDAMPDTPTLERSEVPPAELELRAELDNLAAQVATLDRAASSPAGAGRHPLARFRSIGEVLWLHHREGANPADVPAELLHRALVDQLPGENPGVIPPGYLSDVVGIINRARPLVDAFGVRTPPATGMEVNWPFFDGDLLTLVAEQATPKTPITSVKVSFKRGTVPLDTYAGGSDIAYQTIRRSGPPYLEQYARVMANAYGAVTDQAAGAAAKAGATAGGAVDLGGVTAESDLRGALFAASVEVQAATGTPASFVVASSDVFGVVGGMPGLWPAQYGTNNTSGTADAATLAVNVSGLPIYHDPYLAAGTMLVSNRQAAGWFEEGPFVVTAEDVEKLGLNWAIWGMGAFGLFIPGGVIALTLTMPVVQSTATSSSSTSSK